MEKYSRIRFCDKLVCKRNVFRAANNKVNDSEKRAGHYEYYGISENYRSIYKFYKLAIKLAKK